MESVGSLIKKRDVNRTNRIGYKDAKIHHFIVATAKITEMKAEAARTKAILLNRSFDSDELWDFNRFQQPPDYGFLRDIGVPELPPKDQPVCKSRYCYSLYVVWNHIVPPFYCS